MIWFIWGGSYVNSGGDQSLPKGRCCLRRPWTVIYGSEVDVLMDWAFGTYPSQVCSPIPEMDMFHGSISTEHKTSSHWLRALRIYVNTEPNVSHCWRMNRPLVTHFTNRHFKKAQRESRDQDRWERLQTACTFTLFCSQKQTATVTTAMVQHFKLS